MAKAAVKDKAPAKVAEPEVKKQEVVTTRAEGVNTPPAHLAAQLAESTGRGVSTARDDNVIPLIYVLQKSSPVTDERSDDYVEGAKAGELWVRGTDRVIKGVDGLLIQPCVFLKCWIEWGPKRGDGFKGRHADRPGDAAEKELPNEKGELQFHWVRANGNLVVETREHYVLDEEGNAFVIPFTSTGHTVSRTWMALMNSFRDGRGKPYDSFARRYRLTTVRKEKAGNSWYVIKATDEGWVPTAEAYDRGRALYDAVMSGEKTADVPVDDGGDEGIGGTGGNSSGLSAEEANERAEGAGI